jgi:hypothetical protein
MHGRILFEILKQSRILQMLLALALIFSAVLVRAQEVLPFPTPPMGDKVGTTMQESVHKWRESSPATFQKTPPIAQGALHAGGRGEQGAAHRRWPVRPAQPA